MKGECTSPCAMRQLLMRAKSQIPEVAAVQSKIAFRDHQVLANLGWRRVALESPAPVPLLQTVPVGVCGYGAICRRTLLGSRPRRVWAKYDVETVCSAAASTGHRPTKPGLRRCIRHDLRHKQRREKEKDNMIKKRENKEEQVDNKRSQ